MKKIYSEEAMREMIAAIRAGAGSVLRGDKHSIDDAVQDVIPKLLEREDIENMKSFARQAGRYAALNMERRGRKNIPLPEGDQMPEGFPLTCQPPLVEDMNSLFQEWSKVQQIFSNLIEALECNDKKIFIGRFLYRLSAIELAKSTGKETDAVRRQALRILSRLRDQLIQQVRDQPITSEMFSHVLEDPEGFRTFLEVYKVPGTFENYLKFRDK